MTDTATEQPAIQKHDLEIRIDARLGQSLLHALEFPLQIDFSEDDAEPLDLEVSEEHSEQTSHDESEHHEGAHDESLQHDDGIEAIVEDVLIQPLVDHLDRTHKAQRPAGTPPDRRYQVMVRSLSVIVPTAPELSLGNPVELSNVALRVKAQLKIGVRILGKWRWRDTTTPWVDLEGRKATLMLDALNSQVVAVPELQDTGVAITLNIWKWKLKCRLGLSKWINRQLAKRGPFKVVDFADFHLGTEMLGKTPHFQIGSILNTADHLSIKADVSWK